MQGAELPAAPAAAPGRAPQPLAGRRVALVHHWMVERRGGERALAALAALVPGAALFTLVHDAARCPSPPGLAAPRTSLLQRLPGGRRWFRAALPLHPRLYGAFDLSGFDVVLSSDAALAKTVRVPEGVPHLCYCYSPPRWAWDLAETYLRHGLAAPLRAPARALLAGARTADLRAAARVTRFVAISRHVARRIERCYGRPSLVVPPPVDTAFFTPGPPQGAEREPAERPYLLLGSAVPYKRFDLAVAACRELDRPLVVAGGGPRWRSLHALAGRRTTFVRDPDDEQVRALYRACRALLFPGEEDFGLVPVEAMACGRPVVARAAGGALETVVDGETGCLYDGEDVDALVAALRRFESIEPGLAGPAAVRRAARFATPVFLASMAAALEELPAG